jgi:hypothetical protein
MSASARLRSCAISRSADSLHLAADVALGALGLELGEVGLEALGAGLDVGVAAVLDLLLLDVDLRLERRQVAVPRLVVDVVIM